MPPAFSDDEKNEFLSRAVDLGEGWQGTKFLGKGGFAIAGLWKYHSSEPERNWPKVREVVVKQSTFEDAQWESGFLRDVLDEGRIGTRLAAIGSQHIVRQYSGNILGTYFGNMGMVIRLFLEYCPRGDLDQFLPKNDEQEVAKEGPLREVDLWAIFNCVALGVAAIARGTEDVDKRSWWGSDHEKFGELMHGDMHVANIFLGYHDTEHKRIPVAKIGDFGEAVYVKPVAQQDSEYGGTVRNRGARELRPPEETIRNHRDPYWRDQGVIIKQPRKGTCSNIWQLGAIMNYLMVNRRINYNRPGKLSSNIPAAVVTQFKITDSSSRSKYINTHAQGLDTEIIKEYSVALRNLMAECMVTESLERPSITDIVRRTRMGLESARNEAADFERQTGRAMYQRLSYQESHYRMFNPEPPLAWTIHHERWEDGEFSFSSIPDPTPKSSPKSSLFRGIKNFASKVTKNVPPPAKDMKTLRARVPNMFNVVASKNNLTPPTSKPVKIQSRSGFGSSSCRSCSSCSSRNLYVRKLTAWYNSRETHPQSGFGSDVGSRPNEQLRMEAMVDVDGTGAEHTDWIMVLDGTQDPLNHPPSE